MMFTWIVRGENVENSAKVSVYCVVLYLYLYSNEILIESRDMFQQLFDKGNRPHLHSITYTLNEQSLYEAVVISRIIKVEAWVISPSLITKTELNKKKMVTIIYL